jgi:thymidine phosphorylase
LHVVFSLGSSISATLKARKHSWIVGASQNDVLQVEALAESMVVTCESNGLVPTMELLTQMDQPIGRVIENWLELRECIDIMTPNIGQEQQQNQQLSHDLTRIILVQAA